MKITTKQKSLEVNAALNILKQCLAIIFPLITFPYISRKLGSEGYGIYSFSWSYTSYFVLLAAMGIQTYSIREGARIRDDKHKLEDFSSQIFTINLFSASTAIILLFLIAYTNSVLRRYLLYIAIESVAIILALFGREWLNSIYEDYFYITIRYIAVQFIALIAMFTFVKSAQDVWIYCVLAIFASFGGNIPNILHTRLYSKFKITRNINFKKHIVPILTLFANNIAMMVFVNSDIIMLGFFFDDSTVGVYSLSSKIYSVIKQMLNAIVIVALPRVTHVLENSKDEYRLLVSKIFNYIMIVLIPVSVGVFMLSDSIILLVGGGQYIAGSATLKILSISVIFAMIGSFMMNCILIANRQDNKCFTSTLIAALSNVLLNFLLLKRLGIIGAAFTTLVAELINAILMTSFSKRISQESILNIRNLIECILGSIGVVIICFIANNTFNHIVLRIIVSIFISISVYLVFMLAIKNTYFRFFLEPIVDKVKNKRGRRK